jgi:hypothetical protein
MNTPISPCEQLHLDYCQFAGHDPEILRFCFYQQSWQSFLANGFVRDDLRIVMAYVKKQNEKYTIKRPLRIRSLIDDMPRFCEDLAEARRLEQRRPTAKEMALGELRGFVPPRQTATLRTVGDVLRQNGLT